MTTSNVPPTPPADDEFEARLRASWQHAVARAEDDLSRGDLVPSALAAGRRRQPWRVAVRLTLGTAAVLVLGLAIIVGSGGRRDPVEPPASPAGPIGSPAAQSGSPEPGVSADPGDGEGTPVLEPGVTFPPTVNGQAVVTVGPEADAKIAVATDDSPIYVSGWILGPDPLGCAQWESPAPNGVIWNDCAAIPLRATEDGGATLRVHISYTDEARYPRLPDATHVLPVLVKVHPYDAGCTADDCAHKPVLDTVVQYGAPRMAPVLRAMTRPPGGITMEQAVTAADAYAAKNSLGYGLPLV
ncbi:MAG: hypothetical protein Q8M74_05040, partial [Chloroflexota bacterium]|nr:hypothetical protein [Chloroflexota bacterium]